MWDNVSLKLLPVWMWSFYSLFWRAVYLICRGDCSICGCKFGVSVEGGEFRVLLYCRFVPEPSTNVFRWNYCNNSLSALFPSFPQSIFHIAARHVYNTQSCLCHHSGSKTSYCSYVDKSLHGSWPPLQCYLLSHSLALHSTFLKKDFIFFIFRGWGREGKREGNISSAPYWGPGGQPRHVPWLQIKPATVWFTGQDSIHWATPARTPFHFSGGSETPLQSLHPL